MKVLTISSSEKVGSIFKIVVLGKAKIEFAANVEVKDGKAETINFAVLNYLNSNNILVKKLSGLRANGTLVMTGCHNGSAVQLQRLNAKIVSVWCVAHKLALVIHWAFKVTPIWLAMKK